MFLEMLLGGSALILAVLLLRAILGKRMGARLRYLLWLPVLFRLLVPVSVGQFAASPANLARTAERDGLATVYSVPVFTGSPSDTGVALLPDGTVSDPNSFGYARPNQDGTVTRFAFKTALSEALPLVWKAGMAVAAIWFMLCNILFYRDLRRTRRLLRHIGKTPVYMAETTSPCLFGLFRPAIYVTPAVAEDEAALGHVLLHEGTHLRHGDHIWALLRTVCLTVWWFNPLVWLAAALSRRDCELCCDDSVICLLGEDNRVAYGKTLLALAGGKRRSTAAFCAASTLSGSGNSLRHRIRAIANRVRPRLWAIVPAALLVALATACAFSGAKAPLEIPTDQPPVDLTPSQAVFDAIRANWEAWNARSETQQLLSSTMPGSVTRGFDSWDEALSWLGFQIQNPLETLDGLEKGNCAGMPEGDVPHVNVRCISMGDSTVTQIAVLAGYRLGDVQITLTATLQGEAAPGQEAQWNEYPEKAEVTAGRAGRNWAEWAVLGTGKPVYLLAAGGEPGMEDEVHAAMEMLLPCFLTQEQLDALPGYYPVENGGAEQDFAAMFQQLAATPEDATLYQRLANLQPDSLYYCVDYLLAHPGCLDGLGWDDHSLPAVIFRFFDGVKSPEIDMPLVTDTLGEYWDAYVDLACRSYPQGSVEPEDEAQHLLWYLARAADTPYQLSWIDEAMTTVDGLALGMTIEEVLSETDVGGGVNPWIELEGTADRRRFSFDNAVYTFTLDGGQFRLSAMTIEGERSCGMPLCIKGGIGDSLETVLARYGAEMPETSDPFPFYGEAGQPWSATLYHGDAGSLLEILGGSSIARLSFDQSRHLERIVCGEPNAVSYWNLINS